VVLDKFEGCPIGHVDVASEEQVRRAIDDLDRAFRTTTLEPHRRSRILSRAADLIEVHREELTALIVAEAGTANDGIAAVAKHKPDIVLLDLHLPDKPGLQACRELRKIRPQTRVLILTSSSNDEGDGS